MLLLPLVFLYNCIGNDYIDDRVDERISLNNSIDEILLNETHQLTANFFNNVGILDTTELTWFSLQPTIISVNNTGLITGLEEGSATIRVEVITSLGSVIFDEIEIKVSKNPINDVPDIITRSGTIISTSSYLLEGDFTISEISSSQDLNLNIADNYNASTSLPGLYIYLSNNPNSIAGALEIGAVNVFSGTHSYTIENKGINDYKYLLYWCKPFSVKVGQGEIN